MRSAKRVPLRRRAAVVARGLQSALGRGDVVVGYLSRERA
jgi:hypothetical protein